MDFNMQNVNTLSAIPPVVDLFNNKRYFASNDAEIYFASNDSNDQFVDDIVQIAFQMQQSVLPLYGYNSYTYDDIAVGARQVSGQFIVNFTQENYLYTILETLSGIQTPDRTKAPLWDYRFNIVVHYGASTSKTAPHSTELFVMGVQLTGCSQMLGPTGDPVAEVYSFIAKDVIPALSTTGSSATTSTTSSASNNANNSLNIAMTYNEKQNNGKVAGYISVNYTAPSPLANLYINFKKGIWQAPITIPMTSNTFDYALTDKVQASIRKIIQDFNQIDIDALPAYKDTQISAKSFTTNIKIGTLINS